MAPDVATTSGATGIRAMLGAMGVRTTSRGTGAALAVLAAIGVLCAGALPAHGAPAAPGTSRATAVASRAAEGDRIRPPIAGRPAWLVIRRGVAGMQGAHRVEGVLTFTGDRPYELSGTLDPSSGHARVTYRHVSDDPEVDPSDSLPMELRLDGTTAYRRFTEAMRRDLLADWYSFDLSTADPATTPTEVLVAQWFLQAPTTGLEVEAWSELATTTVGTTTLRHFRGTAPLVDTVQLLGDSKGFLPQLTIEVWVDRSGRIRRVRWTASPDPAYRGKKAPRVRLDATYRPLDGSLVITRPTGRVIDASALYD